ncbi:MAG: hypothetical protein A2010_01205 [Nitrospirae bacterium GWD2_57_9]|nr:MAG: hypothetical protein A2010_01205 [Nitrospirae bacterium GWD2_57_9]
MINTIVIKIESGIVSEVYASAPIQVIVVDHDVIEGGETFEQRVHKSVSTMEPDKGVRPEDIEALVAGLILECVRPGDRKLMVPGGGVGAAA